MRSRVILQYSSGVQAEAFHGLVWHFNQAYLSEWTGTSGSICIWCPFLKLGMQMKNWKDETADRLTGGGDDGSNSSFRGQLPPREVH